MLAANLFICMTKSYIVTQFWVDMSDKYQFISSKNNLKTNELYLTHSRFIFSIHDIPIDDVENSG